LYPNVIKSYDLSKALKKHLENFKSKGLNTTQAAIKTDKFLLLTEGKIGTKYINGATETTLNNYFF